MENPYEIFYDNNIYSKTVISSSETEYFLKLQTGSGILNFYRLITGIDLIFLNFHAENCNDLNSEDFARGDVLILNYCKKGRFETQVNGRLVYLADGDFVIATADASVIHEFTLGYYEGIEIRIDIPLAQKTLNRLFCNNSFDLSKIRDKVVTNDECLIIRSDEKINEISTEMYNVNEDIKYEFYILKVIELLLFIKTSKTKNMIDNFPKLDNQNVKKIKEIKKYLAMNYNKNITLKDLSEKYQLSPTSIKNYFKEIYGKPIFTWWREYRLNKATEYLKNTTMNVKDIAKEIGYTNPSKFTSSFKKHYNQTPTEYRNNHI